MVASNGFVFQTSAFSFTSLLSPLRRGTASRPTSADIHRSAQAIRPRSSDDRDRATRLGRPTIQRERASKPIAVPFDDTRFLHWDPSRFKQYESKDSRRVLAKARAFKLRCCKRALLMWQPGTEYRFLSCSCGIALGKVVYETWFISRSCIKMS